MLSTEPKQPTSEYWAVDSAATDHMCNNKQAFTGQLIPRKTIIRLGDHSEVHSDFYGHIVLTSNTNKTIRALYVPEFRISLLSVRQLDKDGWTSTFGNGKAVLRDPRSVCLTVPSIDNLYRFKLHQLEEAYAVTTRSKAKEGPGLGSMDSTQEVPLTSNNPHEIMEIEPQGTPTVEEIDAEKVLLKELKKKMLKENESIQLWHRRLAHMNPNSLKSALEKLAPKVNHDQGWDEISPCDICIQSKHAQKFERQPTTRATAPFELIHSDLCGPFTPSVGGATYYIVYVDDYTRYTEVVFLKSKEAPEVLDKFQRFHAWIKTQGYTVKRFRCDNGRGEFNNTAFEDELAKAGITYEPAPPYTQHKNGTAERMIRTLNTKAKMHDARCEDADAILGGGS
jgi:transposase InsO family protein